VRDVARAVRRAPVRASSRTVWLPLGRWACHFPNVLPVDQSHPSMLPVHRSKRGITSPASMCWATIAQRFLSAMEAAINAPAMMIATACWFMVSLTMCLVVCATQYPEAAKVKRSGSSAAEEQFPMVSPQKLSAARSSKIDQGKIEAADEGRRTFPEVAESGGGETTHYQRRVRGGVHGTEAITTHFRWMEQQLYRVKVGRYGGKYRRLAPTAGIASSTPAAL
jgi:hypothetical protein